MRSKLTWAAEVSASRTDQRTFWADIGSGHRVRIADHHGGVTHSWNISIFAPSGTKPLFSTVYVTSDERVVKHNALDILLRDLSVSVDAQKSALAVLGEVLVKSDDGR